MSRRACGGVLVLLAAATVAILARPPSARAFSEDLCPNERGGIENCISKNCDTPSLDTVNCYVNLVLTAGIAYASEAGRSMVHVDSIYFIAQALGFRSDVAYWIAAYVEVADIGQYIPFDRCGTRLTDERWKTPVLEGWTRLSWATGGLPYHFGTFYVPEGGDTAGRTGLAPDRFGQAPTTTYDPVYEGAITHERQWAFDDGPACTGGITERDPANGSYFSGSACYQIDPAYTIPKIQGSVPVLYGLPVPFQSWQGNQIAEKDESGGGAPFCAGVHYAKPGIADACNPAPLPDLAAIVEGSSGRLQDGSPVPVDLARMGFFLHFLMDRASHYQCGDESSLSGPDANGVFRYSYSDVCSGGWHAVMHSLEVGKPTLAVQTYTALDYAYDELESYADRVRERHPDWLRDGQRRIGKADLVGTITTDEDGESFYSPGILTRVLTFHDARVRLEAMNRAIADAGYTPMPGNTPDVECR